MVKFYGKSVAIFATSLLLMFTACQEKDLYEGGKGGEEEESNNPSLNDYSTIQNVKFNLNYDVPEGYVAKFDVYAENPFTEKDFELEEGNENSVTKRTVLRSDIQPISGGISISGKYNLDKSLPAYVSEVYVYSPSMFVPTLMKGTIQSGVVNFETVSMSGTASRSSAPTTRTLANKMPDYYLKYDGGVGKTELDDNNNLLIPGAVGPNHEPRIAYHEDFPAGVYNKINTAFPEKQRADDKYRSGTSLYMEKAGEVWISIIHTDGTWWNNTLSYFYHDGSTEEWNSRNGLDNIEIIAIPYAKLNTTDKNINLKSGDYVQLKYYDEETDEWVNEFPAGLTIGWSLRPQTYNTEHRYLTSMWQWPLSSINTLNTDNHRIDCVVFNAGTEEEPFICIGFEDNYKRDKEDPEEGDEDFNDVVFHVVTNPANAIGTEPPTIPPGKDIVTTVNRKGILAFEDNWPKKGDYDLNDVVVKYTSATQIFCKAGTDASFIYRTEDTFSLIHNGGVHPNKFGIKVNVDPVHIYNMTVDGEPYIPNKDSFDGTGFIIELCDNIQDIKSLERYKEDVPPYDYNIEIIFKEGEVSEAQWESVCAPYNPYITPKPNTEVHLPFYSPTDKADMTLFGTEHDKSDVDKKMYYVSGEDTKYPFAIHLSGAETFKLPKEEKNISTTYPDYDKWVQSNGTSYKDWYLK